MPIPRENASYVCHKCTGDGFLASDVKKQGDRRKCTYCGEMAEALTLSCIADRIHEVLGDHFILTSDQPFAFANASGNPSEYPVTTLIAEIAMVSEEIAADITKELSESHTYRQVTQGGDDPYGPSAEYEVKGASDWGYRAWEAFRNEIGSRARFFNSQAEETLSDIFGNLYAHTTFRNRPILCEFGPQHEDQFVWRARIALSTMELETILKCPASQVGPPPSSSAKPGRMNAQGISVFYGATDVDTCIAEVRAPVGSRVVLARFRFLRNVRLLDLEALRWVYYGGSHFNPNYEEDCGRAEFLGSLVGEMSKPVMPEDESTEYVITQAVAEYLASRVAPRLDGILYPSSQTGGNGRNLLLFNSSSGVEPDLVDPNADVKVYISAVCQEAWQGPIVVSEIVPQGSEDKSRHTEPCKGRTDLIRTLTGFDQSPATRSDEPTLSIDLESVAVLKIGGVQYDYTCQSVIRQTTSGPLPAV